MALTTNQQLVVDHLEASFDQFKTKLVAALELDNDRDSQLDDCGVARIQLRRSFEQLWVSLGYQGTPQVSLRKVEIDLSSGNVSGTTEMSRVGGFNSGAVSLNPTGDVPRI